MSPIKNTIEINGKVYDAHTGKHIGSTDDGAELVGNEMAQIKPAAKPKPQRHHKKREHSPVEASRHPERSKTLMRPAVKKPALKTSQKVDHDVIPKVRLGTPGHERIHRAKTTTKSPKVKRFHLHAASVAPPKVHARSEPLEVKEPAVHKVPAPKPVENDWPVVDQFEKALQSASSHMEEFIDEASKSRRGRRWAYVTVSLVALVVIGFGAFQAVPLAKVKLAGNKAGFSPSVPTYSPAGYGLSDPDAKSGEIKLSYKSRTDDKGFDITQTPSEWNSQSLVSNYLEANGKEYQTVYSNGKTIYTYDKANATWVSGGIWFKVESNADLSSDQLVKIANGL